MENRSLVFHLGVAAVAAALALTMWTRDEDAPKRESNAKVEVWGGKPESVQSIEFESEKSKVRLDAKKDSQGLWFVGHVDKTIETKKPGLMPEGGMPEGGMPPFVTETRKETKDFVSVKSGVELAESLAPFKAIRELGKIEDKRKDEFGFDKPEGTLRVKIGGKTHSLLIGGTTPAGGDRYAQDTESGQAYAIPGDLARNMMFAESRLMERDFHGFKAEDVTRVIIKQGDASRELTRLEDKAEGWASKGGGKDETAGNWMSKLNRLRVSDYIEQQPAGAEPVLRVEFFDKGSSLGYFELAKVPGKEPEYVAKSEQTRWYTKVLKSAAAELEQDVASVLK